MFIAFMYHAGVPGEWQLRLLVNFLSSRLYVGLVDVAETVSPPLLSCPSPMVLDYSENEKTGMVH